MNLKKINKKRQRLQKKLKVKSNELGVLINKAKKLSPKTKVGAIKGIV